MRLFLTFLCTLCVLLAGTVGFISLNLSLWFLWEAAPPGDVRLAVSHRHPATETVSQYALAALAPELEPYRNDLRAFAISKQGEQVTLIAQPKLIFNPAPHRETTAALRRDGWHVTRLGLVLVAR